MILKFLKWSILYIQKLILKAWINMHIFRYGIHKPISGLSWRWSTSMWETNSKATQFILMYPGSGSLPFINHEAYINCRINGHLTSNMYKIQVAYQKLYYCFVFIFRPFDGVQNSSVTIRKWSTKWKDSN